MIWSYWEGPRPPIVELCLQTLARHNPSFRLVGPEELVELGGGETLEATAGIPRPYRSDLVRLWLLREFGGVWVDADTICTHPLSIVDEATSCDLWGVFHPRGRDGLLAAPFGARAGSPVIADGYGRCRELLAGYRRTGRLQYGATSVRLLSQLWRIHQRAHVRRRAHWRWFPIHWRQCREVYNRRGRHAAHAWSGAWNPNAELWHLTNPVTHDQAELDVATDDTFAAFVMRKALRIRPAVTGRALEAVERLEGIERPRVVEVGVHLAENAEALLFLRRDLVLLGVDPWAPPTDRYAASEPQQRGRNWQRIYRRAQQRLRPFGDRVQLDRRRSIEASCDVAPQSVDLAFVDGEHTRRGVEEDLAAWSPKIRPGGWIGGHDYGHAKFPGVREAVDRWASGRGLAVERGRDSTWWARL